MIDDKKAHIEEEAPLVIKFITASTKKEFMITRDSKKKKVKPLESFGKKTRRRKK